MKTRVFDTPEALAAEVAGRLAEELAAGPGRAVMLAGGRTPLAAYAALARIRQGLGPSPAWALVSDERMVPRDAPESNHRAMAPHLASAGVPADRMLGVDTSRTLEEAAQDYDRALGRLIRNGVRMSFGLLGLGADGHTASLFSPADIAAAAHGGRFAVAVRRLPPPNRVSVTPAFLRNVETLAFVVAGAEKAMAVRTLLDTPCLTAAGLAVDGHPGVELWTDRAAGPPRPGT